VADVIKRFYGMAPVKKAFDTSCCTFFLGMRIVNYRETVDPEAGGLDLTATLVGAKKKQAVWPKFLFRQQ
jgi:hypothetical protein